MSARRNTEERLKRSAATFLLKKPESSLGDVAAHAGVGRATLHRHFASRDILIGAILQDCLKAVERVYTEAVTLYSENPEALFLEMVGGFIELESEYCFLLREWEIEGYDDVMATLIHQQQEWDAYLQSLVDQDILRADLPLGWHKAGIDGLIVGAWQAVEDQEIGMKQAVRLAKDSIKRAFMV